MYVKIHQTGKYDSHYDNNSGSCGALVEYLEKENEDKDLWEEEHFFAHDGQDYRSFQVRHAIDSNGVGAKLKSKESKFFMLTINPSADELAHIGHDKEKLKAYTRAVMEEYANSFAQTYKDGTKIQGKDLVYFAKVEHERSYKKEEAKYREVFKHNYQVSVEINALKREVENLRDSGGNQQKINALSQQILNQNQSYIKDDYGEVILPGRNKGGAQMHVHIIVSRMDRKKEVRLSPFSKPRNGKVKLNGKEHKIGFDRHQFVGKTEEIFDKQFGYVRGYENNYAYRHAKKHDAVKYLDMVINAPKSPEGLARYMLERAMRQNKEVNSLMHIPTTVGGVRQNVMNKVIDEVAKSMAISPAGLPVQLIKKTLQLAIKPITRGIQFGY
ncbi:MobB family relaxase [Flexithrix dorotheae]|uniref:MobB family relaxase n=1 Tax=Flexithrix dorotheae TaxID=70993 RepID=UPI0003720B94|nr:MobB family relaxase [Flexithrix dorotheae]